MSEEKKPTAPAAGNGAAPIACTTIRLPPDDKKESRANPAGRNAVDPETTVIPPQHPPQAG
ncbi:MAG: hypothetical protein GEV05_00100 [Betaproteobacteria bacterium]|nr:hypothetical protein [Betaproteobacteria bacterium]